MNLITGLSAQPRQIQTLLLDTGESVTISLTFRLQQSGWFIDFQFNAAEYNGLRLVNTPNLLRKWSKILPFGLMVISKNNVEPLNQGDLADGATAIYLLNAADVLAVEQEVYGAPLLPVITQIARNPPQIISITSDSPLASPKTVGQLITLQVVATGSNLSYQWVNYLGSAIAGATSPTYSFIPTTIDQSGTYQCVVSNPDGTTRASTYVSINNYAGPIIVSVESNSPQVVGNAVTMIISATGASLHYQWFDPSAVPIPGATSNLYSFIASSTGQSGTYVCAVTNSGGTRNGSVPITITAAETPPNISSVSGGGTYDVGDSVALSVVATGSSLHYEWRKGGTPISGAPDADSYTFTAASGDSGTYTVRVYNMANSVTSSGLVVIVNTYSYVPNVTGFTITPNPAHWYDTLTFTFGADDADGNMTTYSIINLGSGATVASGSVPNASSFTGATAHWDIPPGWSISWNTFRIDIRDSDGNVGSSSYFIGINP